MSISRRKFLKIGSVSAALIAGSGLGFDEKKAFGQSEIFSDSRIPAGASADLLFSYRADTFNKFIGSPFSLFGEFFAGTAVLIAVTESSFAGRKDRRGKKIGPAENFMLSFQVSNAEAGQETYTVIHRELGQFGLLLVPAQNEKGDFLLNAVINRM